MKKFPFFIEHKHILIPFGPNCWSVYPTLKRKSPVSRCWNDLNNDELFLLNEIYCITEARKRLFVPHYLICSPDTPESRIQGEKSILGLVHHMKHKYGGRWDILGQTKALETSLIQRGYIEEIKLKDTTNVCGLTEKGKQEILFFRNPIVDKTIKMILPIIAILISITLFLSSNSCKEISKKQITNSVSMLTK